jgi:hypothetical protein
VSSESISEKLTRPRKFSFLVATLLLLCFVALTVVQYRYVKNSYFDDTFIYLHVAQNGVESGSWRYFPNSERPALVASSPLRIIALTIATAIAWPLTQGERSLDATAVVLPLSALVTALLFLPFWWRDRWRYLLLCIPYAALAATLDAISEFEAGLIYWWLATVVRDFVERRTDRQSDLCVALGPLIRPDLALIAIPALLLALQSRGDALLARIRNWFALGLVLFAMWWLICSAFGVWPIPTTYWTKAALPNLFASDYMSSALTRNLGGVLVGVFHGYAALASGLGLLLFSLCLISAARSPAFAGWRIALLLAWIALLLSRIPANYFWYYQNALVAAIAIAIGCLIYARRSTANVTWALLVATTFVALFSFRALRDPDIPWHFERPSRVQGYLAMARTYAADGTIELPGLGRGYLENPEIGITAYFGGRNAWILDSAGLAQAHEQALSSPLRYFYRGRLRKPPEADLDTIARSRTEVSVFVAWALDDRDPAKTKYCQYVVFDGSVCVSEIRQLR